MLENIYSSIQGLLPFVQYFLMAIVLLVLFVRIYVRITPHKEFALIAENNVAASVAFAGALIGFALPLASAISHSMSLIDCAIWSVVALVAQVLTFLALRYFIKQISERITKGELATAVLVAACSIAVGIINAACMTY